MDFQDWFKKLPPITKGYMVGVFATTSLISFGLVNYSYLILTYEGLVENKWVILNMISVLIHDRFGQSLRISLFLENLDGVSFLVWFSCN